VVAEASLLEKWISLAENSRNMEFPFVKATPAILARVIAGN
jgi:hypothetical protein